MKKTISLTPKTLVLSFLLLFLLLSCSSENGGDTPTPPPPPTTPASISTATVASVSESGVYQDGDQLSVVLTTTNKKGFEAVKISLLKGSKQLKDLGSKAVGSQSIAVEIPITEFEKGKRIKDVQVKFQDSDGGGGKTVKLKEFEREAPQKKTTETITVEL